jgi:hypothetical protein
MRADIKSHVEQLSSQHRKAARHFSGQGTRDLEELSNLLPESEPALLLFPGSVVPSERKWGISGYIILTRRRVVFRSPEGTMQNAPTDTSGHLTWKHHTASAAKDVSIVEFTSRGVEYSFCFGSSSIGVMVAIWRPIIRA